MVRVLDPGRAKWYSEQGLQTVCPTQTAIELLEAAVRGQIRFEGVCGLTMYVLIVGAGQGRLEPGPRADREGATR